MSKPRYSTLVRALKFLQIEADFSLNGCSQKEIRDSYSGLHKAARFAESLVARAVGEKTPRTKKGKAPNSEFEHLLAMYRGEAAKIWYDGTDESRSSMERLGGYESFVIGYSLGRSKIYNQEKGRDPSD